MLQERTVEGDWKWSHTAEDAGQVEQSDDRLFQQTEHGRGAPLFDTLSPPDGGFLTGFLPADLTIALVGFYGIF